MIKNKRVLITGSTGFIGANLTRKCLDVGAQVYILTRATSDKWRIQDILQDVNEYDIDLLEHEKLKSSVQNIKPEVIFHTATYGGYPFQKEEGRIIQTNLEGTINLVDACSKIGFDVDVFVNTGSSSEYGIKDNPIKETDLLEPNSVYGASKASATLFCQTKAKIGNLPIITLRLFSPYGYYEDPTRLIPSVVISCLEGRNPQLLSPQSVRDFIFIEDVVETYMKVVEQPKKAGVEIFNIGSGRQYTVKEVVDVVVKLMGNSIKPEWGTMPNPRVEPKMWQADISKAKEILGWQPKYNLTQGLEKTIDWFRENKRLYK